MQPERRVLAVDDRPDNLLILEECLADSFLLKCVTSGREALRVAPGFVPNVVLLDLMMPEMDGQETCRRLCALPQLRYTKVVMLSAKSDIIERLAAYEAGAVDYIAKPFDYREVLAKVTTWAEMVHRRQVEAVWEDAEQVRAGVGRALASLVEMRDTETGDHLFRMQWYSQLLAEQLAMASPYHEQIDEQFLHRLYRASPLHDIGKVAIDDAILRKPGRLTPDEFEIVKKHAALGADILARTAADLPGTDYLELAIAIARHHHERFDGGGYPDGLSGHDIPLAARIVSVADVFDALTSDRVYRSAIPPDQAGAMIAEGAGSQFDPEVVRAFVVRFDEIRQAWERFWAADHARSSDADLVGVLRDCQQRHVDHLEYSLALADAG